MERILENAEYYKRKNFEPKNEPTFEREYHWKPLERETYEKLCRGEVKKSEDLTCFYYKGNDNFYLQLGPVKTEILNHSPHIVRFHDVYR